MQNYDLLVIGSGPGGYVAAIRASQLGMKVAVAEAAQLGGVCLNWGCLPTKALLKSAQAFKYAKHAAEYGFSCGEPTPDFSAIVARSRNVAATMSKGIEFLFKKNKIDLIKGHATFCADRTVEISGAEGVQQVSAKHIIVATGAHARALPNVPIDGKKVIGYQTALTLQHQPKSLLIMGSGAIGSELAYFYSTIGTQVTLVEFLPAVVPNEDEEVSAQLSRSMRKNGIKVMVNSAVESVDISGELCKVNIKTKKGEETIEAETVLSAVGIAPNIDCVGFEKIGVAIERGRVKVDEFYRTNIEGVYAIGDIIATPALAHVASAEAVVCVEKIAGLNPKTINYKNIPGCTYTSPEIASVGLSEKKAREEGRNIKIGKFPFTASGKATAAGARDGFIKIVVDAETDEVLGVHCIGDGVTEIIGGVVAARNLGVKAKDFVDAVFPHPTMSEALKEAAAVAHDEAIHI